MKSRIVQTKKQNQKTIAKNQLLKTRNGQVEANDLTRQQELIKQSQKIDKIEGNMKHLTDKIIDQENRSQRDHLRIIGLPEKSETNRNLDIILQEIIQENCPDVFRQKGKIDIERVQRTPFKLNPQKTTPRNVIAKFKSFPVKEKILQEARKRQFRYQGTPIRITQDLAASTLKDHKAWNMILRKARELDLQPRMTYPSKLTIFFQGKHGI